MINKDIAKILYKIEGLLNIKGVDFKPNAYRKAARVLEGLKEDIAEIYKKDGLKGLEEMSNIGKSIAQKIEEYLKKGKIKYYEELKKETAIQQVITYFFETKGLDLWELKRNIKKQKIVYSRYTKPAKQLIGLAGSVKKAKEAIKKMADWAKTRDLDYTIETVFKKWLELDKLKPKEISKKPYFRGSLMVRSKIKKKWFVIDKAGEWLEFAGEEKEIEWRIEK